MHDAAALVVVKQVLAPGARLLQHPAVDGGGAVDKPPLRAGHDDGCTPELALVQPRQPVQRVALRQSTDQDVRRARHARRDVRLFVLGQDVDTTLVPFGFRPLRIQERVDDLQRLGHRVHPAADPDQLGVVVLTGQRRGLHAPRQRTARAGHLVRGDLLAVARAAEHDAETLVVADGLQRGRDAERRIVVLGVVGVGAAVDGLVPVLLEVLDDLLLEFEARVVRAQVDAHGGHSGRAIAAHLSTERALIARICRKLSDQRTLGGAEVVGDVGSLSRHVLPGGATYRGSAETT